MDEQKKIDPKPMRTILEALGYVLVHEWTATNAGPHGVDRHETWQHERSGQMILYITGSLGLTGFRTVRPTDSGFQDYLLAVKIRKNEYGNFERLTPEGKKHVSPCSTASHEHFVERYSFDPTPPVYRVFRSAGHGEWAFKVNEDSLPEVEKIKLKLFVKRHTRG